MARRGPFDARGLKAEPRNKAYHCMMPAPLAILASCEKNTHFQEGIEGLGKHFKVSWMFENAN